MRGLNQDSIIEHGRNEEFRLTPRLDFWLARRLQLWGGGWVLAATGPLTGGI